VAATKPPAMKAADTKFTNLKVLPKDISEKEMNIIMVDEFEDALGVSCNFCHAKQKDSEKLDYASDENPQKENARNMMRMTLEINQKYFMVKHPLIGDSSLQISCNNCHQGQPYPGQ
ncbi:MAG: c-type cytochrome, partial [Chitinophagaceae bacterium]